MRRWGLIVLVFLLALGGALGWAVLSVNRHLNENREWVAAQVGSATGRRVSFGEIGLSFWGGLGARISDVAIADDPAFSEKPVVSASVVRVNVAILPALFGRIEVRDVVLEAPTVRLVRTQSGMNFDTLGAAAEAAPARAAEKTAPPESPREAGFGAALIVALVTIRDGRIEFVDRTVAPSTTTVVDHLDVRATGVGTAAPAAVEFAVAVLGSDEQNVRVEGTVGPLNLETAENLDSISLDLGLRVGPVILDELRGLPGVGESVPAELSAPDPLTLTGRAHGRLGAVVFEASVDATEARLGYGDAFVKGEGVPLSLSAKGTQLSSRFELRQLELVLASLHLVGSGAVVSGPPVSVDLKLDADKTPLAGWDQVLPPLAGYELAGTAEMHVTAKGQVAGPALPTLGGHLELANVSASQGGAAAHFEGLSTNLEFTGRATEFRGEVRVERGVVWNAAFENFVATLALADDVVSLDRIQVALFGGSYSGVGRYDFRKSEVPRFEFRQELRDLDVSKILASQAPDGAGRLTGRLWGTLELEGSGVGPEALLQSIEGSGEVGVADGVLVGVNLPEAILEGITGVGGLTGLLSEDLRRKYVDLFSAQDTPFEKMSATIEIRAGKAVTDDAIIAARDYSLLGDGSIAFDGELDFTTTFVASSPLTADVLGSVREARYITNSDGRLEVLARVVGVLPDVRVEPDAESVAKSLTRGAIGTGLEILGGSTKKGDALAPQEGDAGDQGKKPSAEEVGADLIEKGLRSLFGD